jgi:tetratricopeptide (TPR) repeat protein
MRALPGPAWLASGLVALAAVAAFSPALRNAFVWDDVYMFVANPDFRGLGWRQLGWMWTTFHIGEYMPLTWMSYGADYLLWGLAPFGYHLTNLLLHAAAALAVFDLARRLLSAGAGAAPAQPAVIGGASAAALVFALHPLRAEPVAWVSARGTILGGLLLLLSVSAYLAAVVPGPSPRRRRLAYGASLGLYLLSLLSRSTGVVLPVVLLALDVYPLRRLGGGAERAEGVPVRRVVGEKIPFVALSAAILPLALAARGLDRLPDTAAAAGGLAQGVPVALWGLVFYVWKTLVPGQLSPLYERPSRLDPWEGPLLLSGVLALLVTLALVRGRRRWPAGLAAWACYAALLAPVLGVMRFGDQLAADRYSYVACVTFAVLVGSAVLAGWRAWQAGRLPAPALVGALVVLGAALAGLAASSYRQVGVWRDNRSLWTHAAAAGPRTAAAHLNLARMLAWDGDSAAALRVYEEALRRWPGDGRIHAATAGALLALARVPDALAHLRTAVSLRPAALDTQVALGNLLVSLGRIPEAIAHYRQAVRALPGSALMRHNLASVLALDGQRDEALAHYEAALRIEPGFTEARLALARARGWPR